MSEGVNEVFERVSLAQLQFAVDATEGRPEVTDIWVYTSYVGGFVTGFVVYGVEGHQPVQEYDLDSVLREPVGSMTEEWQARLGDGISDEAMKYFYACREAGEEHPSRIVVHYDVRGAKMDASFSYNKLDEGELDPVPIFDKWFVNAKATGDFSADATTVPGSDG